MNRGRFVKSVQLRVFMPPTGVINSPPTNWKTGLDEASREMAWRYAAGSNKTNIQHKSARSYVTSQETLRLIRQKKHSCRTKEEHIILKKHSEKVANNIKIHSKFKKHLKEKK
jgi:hypothetical protein